MTRQLCIHAQELIRPHFAQRQAGKDLRILPGSARDAHSEDTPPAQLPARPSGRDSSTAAVPGRWERPILVPSWAQEHGLRAGWRCRGGKGLPALCHAPGEMPPGLLLRGVCPAVPWVPAGRCPLGQHQCAAEPTAAGARWDQHGPTRSRRPPPGPCPAPRFRDPTAASLPGGAGSLTHALGEINKRAQKKGSSHSAASMNHCFY